MGFLPSNSSKPSRSGVNQSKKILENSTAHQNTKTEGEEATTQALVGAGGKEKGTEGKIKQNCPILIDKSVKRATLPISC